MVTRERSHMSPPQVHPNTLHIPAGDWHATNERSCDNKRLAKNKWTMRLVDDRSFRIRSVVKHHVGIKSYNEVSIIQFNVN